MQKIEGNLKGQIVPSNQVEAVSKGALPAGHGQKVIPYMPRLVTNTMLAKRYELKYHISEQVAQAIKGYILGYLTPDPYTRRQPDGQYSICSLYLDSGRFDLFRETLLDKCNRFKLRIRGYDDNPDTPVFFEIKRKLNRIIYKSRAKAPKDKISDILYNHYIPPTATEADRMAFRQFTHYTQCLAARPVVLVRYKREAYENNTAAKVRITFDRQLSYQIMDKPVVRVNGPGWKKVPINFVVLEIKFTGQFPTWVTDVVRLFELNRESMSKYCHSVRGIAPMLAQSPVSLL